MKWKHIANAQLAGQIDRVLAKVVQCYGPEGAKYGEKQLKIADLVVSAELGKMMDLIRLSPKLALRERKRNVNLEGCTTISTSRRGRMKSRNTTRRTAEATDRNSFD